MPAADEGKPIDPGIVQRVREGVSYMITGIKPTTWFGPSQPMKPVTEDPSAKGRIWDYAVGINLRTQPRADEGIPFALLRALADKHDITRLAIETRKDQVCALDWDIVMKDEEAEPAEDEIKAARELLNYPDQEQETGSWLRELVEELLVTDALAIEPRKNVGGQLARLDIIDGTTIIPRVDASGRTPMPPSVAYQQILKGVPASDFSTDTLLYRRRNRRVWKLYGMSPVEQIFLTINISLRRQVSILQHFTEGNVPEAIMLMPQGMTAEQIAQFDLWFNGLMAGNTAEKRKIKFMPGGEGAQLIETGKVDLKDMFDEWLARIVCFCFSISPTALMAQTNRATAETVEQTAKDEGLVPLLKYIEAILTQLLNKWGGLQNVQFKFKREDDQDPAKKAQADDISVRNGTKSIDEVREENGLEAIGIGHGIITATGWVPLPTEDNKKNHADIFEAQEEQRRALLQAGKPSAGGDGEEKPETKKPKEEAAEKAEAVVPLTRATMADLEKALGHAASKVIQKKKTVIKTVPAEVPADVQAKLTQVYYNFLAPQGKKVARACSRIYAKLVDTGKLAKGILEKKASPLVEEVLEGLDEDQWAILIEPTKKALREVARRGAASELQRLKVTNRDTLDQVDEKAVAYAQKRSAQLVGRRLVDGKLVPNPNAHWAITKSTRDMLRTTVTTAVEEGWSPQKLATAIEDGAAFSHARAVNIARTELGDAHMAGNVAAWKQAGAKRKRVLLGSEHKEEDECSVNAEQGWIPFDEEYSSGHQHPLFHPGCVCDEEIELEGEGGEEPEVEVI